MPTERISRENRIRVTISPSDRVLIVGKTGSGKTTLAKVFLKAYSPVVILDSLYRTADSDWPPAFTIFRDVDQFSQYIKRTFHRGNYVVYIDELLEVAEHDPDIFSLLVTRGRAQGIGTWYATQRPRGIPRIALSEAEHLFVFRLALLDDRKLIYELVGQESVLRPPVDSYGFWYYDVRKDQLIYSRGLHL